MSAKLAPPRLARRGGTMLPGDVVAASGAFLKSSSRVIASLVLLTVSSTGDCAAGQKTADQMRITSLELATRRSQSLHQAVARQSRVAKDTHAGEKSGSHKAFLEIESLIQAKSYVLAREKLARLRKSDSESAEALLAAADLDRATGLFGKAMNEYKQLLVQAPTMNKPVLALVGMYLEYMNPREALQLARKAVSRQPESRSARLALCESLIACGYLKEADEDLSLLSKTYANDPEVEYVAYELAKERGNLALARSSLEQAIKLRPAKLKWQLKLSDLCTLQGDFAEALRRLDLVLADEQYSVDAMEKRAVLLEFYCHDYDDAIKQYQAILDIDPDSVTALAGIDRCKVRRNDVAGLFKFEIRKSVAWLWSLLFRKPQI